MSRALLIWNAVLTVLLVAGLGILGYYLFHLNQVVSVLTEDNLTLHEAVSHQATVINQQTEVINQQSKVIDQNVNVTYQEYYDTLEKNEATMEEMAILISRYEDMVNKDAAYFKKISEHLEGLSLVLPQWQEAN